MMRIAKVSCKTDATGTKTQKNIAKVLTASPIRVFFKESALFLGIFVSVLIVSIAFINANLIYHTVKDLFSHAQAESYDFGAKPSTAEEYTSFLNSIKNSDESGTSEQYISVEKEIERTLANKGHDFSYSLVPPGNRIFIPAIGVDAPIIDLPVATETKLKKGDFMQELYSGVVKYPSTPDPGSKGNTLIFGHTSYYWWKKNEYGEIFSKIYTLKNNDIIKVAWKGQLYTYKIVDIVYTTPAKVDEEYLKYTDGEYVTLMGCYPVGSDTRRGLVIAKRVSGETLDRGTSSK